MEGSLLSHALTTLFILLEFAANMGSSSATRPPISANNDTTNTAYIKKSCGITLYPELCYNSLSAYANKIQDRPERLASTAISVTLSAARSSSAAINQLSRSPGLKPRESGAMADCVYELVDSVEELRRSMVEMAQIGSANFQITISDVQTWVSAALTDDDTCMDGFAGMNGQVKGAVRGHVLRVAQLTSNALALIADFAGGHN